MARTQRTSNSRSKPGDGVSRAKFAATPFAFDVGQPAEIEDDSAAALSPAAMQQMVPLNLEGYNGAPADQQDEGFYKNLVGSIDTIELQSCASELVQAVERDADTYAELDETMARGIDEMGFDRSNDKRTDPFPGAAAVVHPMLAQAVSELVARSSKELLPPAGPAKMKNYGTDSPVKAEKSKRAAAFLNWQLTEQCPEYRTEFEKMLTIVSFVGDATRKLYWDDDYNRPRSEFVNSDQFLVPYGISDLETAPRYTHLMFLFKDQVEGYIASGLWAEVQLPAPTSNNMLRSKIKDKTDKVTQQRPSSDDRDAQYEMLEIHADWHFKSLKEDQETVDPNADQEEMEEPEESGIGEEDEEDDKGMVTLKGVNENEGSADEQAATGTTDNTGGERKKKPFIITIERNSKKVLSIRRNWKKDDKKCRKRVWFMHYTLFPWVGWRGIGLWHIIGGLQKAATGALRALLDAAALKSMPGGIRLKGSRTSGSEIRFRPLDYVEVDAPGATDIRQVAMPIPFDGPSPVLMELLGFLATAGSTFASIATKPVAEMNPNAPVGTTLALIEESGRVYNAIHARLHFAQKKELALLCELNYENLDDQAIQQAFGGEIIAKKEDFAGDVGIVPVSDPEVSNQIQRLTRSQSLLSLATQAKASGVTANVALAYKQAARAIGADNVDELFPDPPQAQPLDPISELMALVKGTPVDAFPGQNHEAHVAFMRNIAQNPQYMVLIQGIAPQFMALGQAHLVLAIKDKVEQQLQASLPDGKKLAQLPPPQRQQAESMIAQKVAEVSSKLPVQDMFGTDPNNKDGSGGLGGILGQVAMAEIEADRQKAEIDASKEIRITNAKLAADKESKMWDLMVKLVVEFAKIDSAENMKAADIAHNVVANSQAVAEKFVRMIHDITIDHRKADTDELKATRTPLRQAAE